MGRRVAQLTRAAVGVSIAPRARLIGLRRGRGDVLMLVVPDMFSRLALLVRAETAGYRRNGLQQHQNGEQERAPKFHDTSVRVRLSLAVLGVFRSSGALSGAMLGSARALPRS